MNPARNGKSARALLLLRPALLLLAYVGSYFAVLSLPETMRLPPWLTARHPGIQVLYMDLSGEWTRHPDYRGLPDWLFAPVHYYDRTRLRPGLWSGSHPRNQELSFDWLNPR